MVILYTSEADIEFVFRGYTHTTDDNIVIYLRDKCTGSTTSNAFDRMNDQANPWATVKPRSRCLLLTHLNTLVTHISDTQGTAYSHIQNGSVCATTSLYQTSVHIISHRLAPSISEEWPTRVVSFLFEIRKQYSTSLPLYFRFVRWNTISSNKGCRGYITTVHSWVLYINTVLVSSEYFKMSTEDKRFQYTAASTLFFKITIYRFKRNRSNAIYAWLITF